MLSGKLATLAKVSTSKACRNDSASFPACGKYTKRVLAPGSKCTGRGLKQTARQAVTREIQGSCQHSEKYKERCKDSASHLIAIRHATIFVRRADSAPAGFSAGRLSTASASLSIHDQQTASKKAVDIISRYAHYCLGQLKLHIPLLCRPNIGRLRIHSTFFCRWRGSGYSCSLSSFSTELPTNLVGRFLLFERTRNKYASRQDIPWR